MKKRISIIIVLLATATICFLSVLFAACKSNEITFVSSPVKYMVGDNIDAFSFIERKEGRIYSFAYAKNAETEKTEIKDRSFVVFEAGEYLLYCTETYGDDTKEGQTVITVYDTPPIAKVPNGGLVPNIR